MESETTSVLGLITGKIKNNPSIYASKNSFRIFLNGEFILEWKAKKPKSERIVFEYAKEVLEQLKFGEFFNEEVQKRFDSFIRE